MRTITYSVFHPRLPRKLDQLLGLSERWRAYRRRHQPDDPDYGPSKRIPDYPRWYVRRHEDGFDTRYTRYGGKCWSVGLYHREHTHPSYYTTLQVWRIEDQPNAHYTSLYKGVKVYDQHWHDVQESVWYTLEEAEADRAHTIATWEDRMMEMIL